MEVYGTGCLPSKYDVRDFVLLNQDYSSLPKTFSLGTLRIKNQGAQSTCTAHVMSEIVEYHHFKDTNQYIQFSTEFVYGMRTGQDAYIGDGMYLRDALKVINQYGDVIHRALPGNHDYKTAMKAVGDKFNTLKNLAYENRISTYYKIRSIDEVKYAVVNHGPVAAGMRWYDGATSSDSGVLKYDKHKKWSGHAVLIVGYDEQNLIVQNSWGTLWGMNGTFKLTYDQFNELVFESYGVTDDIKAIKKPLENKDKLVDLINMIVRNLTSLKKTCMRTTRMHD